MTALVELTLSLDIFQRDHAVSILIFRRSIAVKQLAKVAVALSQQPCADLIDFIDDGIVNHDSSSSGAAIFRSTA